MKLKTFVPHAVIDPAEVTYERVSGSMRWAIRASRSSAPRPYDHPDHNPATRRPKS
jgi:hypothetical protein